MIFILQLAVVWPSDGEKFSPTGRVAPLCGSFPQMVRGRAFDASPASYRWQLQLMPLQDLFQFYFIKVGLLEELFDARLVLRPPHAGGNGHDVLGAENFRRHALIIDALGFAHGFLAQSM